MLLLTKIHIHTGMSVTPYSRQGIPGISLIDIVSILLLNFFFNSSGLDGLFVSYQVKISGSIPAQRQPLCMNMLVFCPIV